MKIVSFILLIILLLVISAFLFCLFSKLRLVVLFSKPSGGKFTSSVRLEFLCGKIKKNIPLDRKRKKKGTSEENAKPSSASEELSFIQKLKKIYGIFLRIKNTWSKSRRGVRKRILAEEISLSIAFGTGDAAHTGIVTGALWGAIYNVIGFLANFIRVTEPRIAITPDYENELLDFDGKCILTLRAANIISIFLILYINYYFESRKQTKKEKAAINNVNTN